MNIIYVILRPARPPAASLVRQKEASSRTREAKVIASIKTTIMYKMKWPPWLDGVNPVNQ